LFEWIFVFFQVQSLLPVFCFYKYKKIMKRFKQRMNNIFC
jgi:hypothetical protein